MSRASKIWTVIVILLIITGIWWYMDAGNANVPVAAPVSSTQASTDSDASSVLPTAPTDDSNAALNADLNSVNDQMGNLDTDTTNVNTSVASSTTGQ